MRWFAAFAAVALLTIACGADAQNPRTSHIGRTVATSHHRTDRS